MKEPLRYEHTLQLVQSLKRRGWLQPVWLTDQPRAEALAIRFVDVAVHSADGDIGMVSPSTSYQDWRKVQTSAERAATAMRDLISVLSGSGDAPSNVFEIAPALRIVSNDKVDITNRMHQAKIHAEELYEALANVEELRSGLGVIMEKAELVCRDLAVKAEHRAGEINSPRRRGEHDGAAPWKRTLVRHLAEAWVRLTGKRPGTGKEDDKNPFVEFLNAACRDHARPPEKATAWNRAIKAVKAEITEAQVAAWIERPAANVP